MSKRHPPPYCGRSKLHHLFIGFRPYQYRVISINEFWLYMILIHTFILPSIPIRFNYINNVFGNEIQTGIS